MKSAMLSDVGVAPLRQKNNEMANVRLWPKAVIRTESKSVVLKVRFGEKSGRSSLVFGRRENPRGVIR